MVCILEKRDSTGTWKRVGKPLYKSVQSAKDHARWIGLTEREVRVISTTRRIVVMRRS